MSDDQIAAAIFWGVYLLGLPVVAFIVGRCSAPDPDEIGLAKMFVVLFWPLFAAVIVAAIITSPIWGIIWLAYWLGTRGRRDA